MPINVPCYFKICNTASQKESLDKLIFGGFATESKYMSAVKKGDIVFLYNPVEDKLWGIFEAEGPPAMNIDASAFKGQYPYQTKVRAIGDIECIENASKVLKQSDIIKFVFQTSKNNYTYNRPAQSSYGPEITRKILLLFKGAPAEMVEEPPVTVKKVGTITKCKFEEIAGLEPIKEYIRQRIVEPLEYQEAATALGIRLGGGMLLFGPPGTGKTRIATLIAGEIDAKFFEVTPSFIIGYPGDAEKRLEDLFSEIEQEPRSVLFLDEAEWILSDRKNLTSSVMQRIVPVLLSQLSKLMRRKDKEVIIVAATNVPDKIDPAFLRPGRFDGKFHVGLPNLDSRIEILDIYLKDKANKLSGDEKNSIGRTLKGYSGADIEHIIIDASYSALRRHKESGAEAAIVKEDIIAAINKVSPSVTDEENDHLIKWARERGIAVEAIN